MGSTLNQCRGEVDYAADFFRWYAEEARRLYGRTIPHPDASRRLRVEYFSVGVVGVLPPWNGPLGSAAKKIAGALAAGCTVVHKPPRLAPLSAMALAWLTEQAGLPTGVYHVVCGDSQAIGKILLEHPGVRLITCTGSTETGRYLMAEGGRQIKRVCLELGGNAPFIVFADADLERAADDLVQLKTCNSGQVCVTANRIFVERSIYEPFLERIILRLKRHRLGIGTDFNATMGPLIDRRALEKVKFLVDEAIAAGARVRYQGEVPDGCQNGYFYPPTVLEGVTADMPVVREEVFGPVLSVMPFDTEAEVLRLANDTPYGLAAYAYTTDMARAQRCSEELEAGVVGINDPRPITPEAPFGGTKQSGIGHEGGLEGLLEFYETKLIGYRFPS
jgi:succinate-semialdehyde dehydrogenase/glutarate-semialdehyde dehydrogenase